MEPLGRFWESFWSFSRTFGRLLENVSKTIQKVTKVHQKSPKGGPKAPKRLPKSDQKGNVFGAFVSSADFKKNSKTGIENHNHNLQHECLWTYTSSLIQWASAGDPGSDSDDGNDPMEPWNRKSPVDIAGCGTNHGSLRHWNNSIVSISNQTFQS